MKLGPYCKKRDFTATSEPAPNKPPSEPGCLFVVQRHAARHLHYDFRLEVNGVLVSWAVPKGPSMDPRDKRLAVHVEDHPLQYGSFEGSIPKGNYGAGTVEIWDSGTYSLKEANSTKEIHEKMAEGIAKGEIAFNLHGEKLKGTFALVKMKGTKDHSWLLIKKQDEEAKEASAKEKRGKIPKINLSPTIKPMLSSLGEKPFSHEDWLFEIKWDGYRAIAEVNPQEVLLYSRNELSFNKRFPELVEALKSLKIQAVFDGEIIAINEKGFSDFQLLQNFQKNKKGTLLFEIFDILSYEGKDVMPLPLIQRKEVLRKVALPSNSPLRISEYVDKEGIPLFLSMKELKLEGMMAKRKNSPYLPGIRTTNWLKIKTQLSQDAIICGLTKPKGTKKYFGALILGAYQEEKLVPLGQVGTGFTHQMLKEIHQKLSPLAIKNCPFAEKCKLPGLLHWTQPQLVCEVFFREWTREGQLRQAAFKGLREDKKPGEVFKEMPKNIKTADDRTNKNAIHNKQFSHLDKVYWPKWHYTKGDLLNYYQEVSPFILPYLKDRPESLKRFPDGINGQHFFQKDISALNLPQNFATISIEHEDGPTCYLMINDLDSLLYVANLGSIEINPFTSRAQSLESPDYLVIDLDPLEISFEQVIKTAQVIHRILEKIDVPHYCKTSGMTGLHILIPTGAKYNFEQVLTLGKLLAQLIHAKTPDITSTERSPAKRKGKVYLDVHQNSKGQTIAAPYCVRPHEDATVSIPLKWSEVTKNLHPSRFTIKNTLNRLEKVGDLLDGLLGKGIDLKKVIKAIENLK